MVSINIVYVVMVKWMMALQVAENHKREEEGIEGEEEANEREGEVNEKEGEGVDSVWTMMMVRV